MAKRIEEVAETKIVNKRVKHEIYTLLYITFTIQAITSVVTRRNWTN